MGRTIGKNNSRSRSEDGRIINYPPSSVSAFFGKKSMDELNAGCDPILESLGASKVNFCDLSHHPFLSFLPSFLSSFCSNAAHCRLAFLPPRSPRPFWQMDLSLSLSLSLSENGSVALATSTVLQVQFCNRGCLH